MTDAERGAALEAIAAEVRVVHPLPPPRDADQGRAGRGEPGDRGRVRRRGPGQQRGPAGRPFVGGAGGLLTELLEPVGWQREDVFITNVVKCRPPGNRDPAARRDRRVRAVPPAPARGARPGRRRDAGPALARHVHARRADRPGPRHGAAGRPGDRRARRARVRDVPPRGRAPYARRRTRELRGHRAPPRRARGRARRRAGATRGARDASAAGRRRRRATATAEPGADACRRRPADRDPASPAGPAADASSGTASRPTRPSTDQLTSSEPTTEDQWPTPNDKPLRIIPLGGVGEIGKNMYVFEYGDDIVVIDCGLMFPDEEMFGIDLVVPDVTYLKERKANVKAFLITHAHEDHVGGLPYILPEFPGVPVYASTLARGLLGNKIKEHKLHNNPLLPLEPGDEVADRAVHASSRSGSATRSRTRWGSPCGPRSGRSSTPATSSSTTRRSTASCPTSTSSPGWARKASSACCPTRRAPRTPATRRRSGPSARPSARSWSRSTAGSSWPPSRATSPASSRSSTPPASFDRKVDGHRPLDGAELPDRQRPRLPQVRRRRRSSPRTRSRRCRTDKLVICTTGAQGEPMAGLARMANRDHRFVEIQPGDTVIVSASPIPGNEEYVSRTIDNLFKAGANVFYHTIKRAHVSGHASQEELKLMLGLTKPRTSSRSTASSGCRSSTAAWRSRPASLRRTCSSSRTGPRSRSRPTARPDGARRSRPATCTSTGCPWARSATSSCATGRASPTTGCS